MRRFVMLAALTTCLAAGGCNVSGKLAATHSGTYPGGVRSAGCSSRWFTGADDTARFSCAPGGYEMSFVQRGQDVSVTQVETAAMMRVEGTVTAPAGSANRRTALGVVCFFDDLHGWIAEISTLPASFVIFEWGAPRPLASGSAPAIHPRSQHNRLVLTCDATGSRTKLSLSVNGKVVAHDVRTGFTAVRLNRFGIWAAGDVGATARLEAIAATTR
jgi:hypothetical protein